MTSARPPLTALLACSAVVALAVAALAAPAPAVAAKRIYVFGGTTTVQLDQALLAPYGIVVERRGSARGTPTAGLRFKVVDGRTTLDYPPAGKIQTVAPGQAPFATGPADRRPEHHDPLVLRLTRR